MTTADEVLTAIYAGVLDDRWDDLILLIQINCRPRKVRSE